MQETKNKSPHTACNQGLHSVHKENRHDYSKCHPNLSFSHWSSMSILSHTGSNFAPLVPDYIPPTIVNCEKKKQVSWKVTFPSINLSFCPKKNYLSNIFDSNAFLFGIYDLCDKTFPMVLCCEPDQRLKVNMLLTWIITIIWFTICL